MSDNDRSKQELIAEISELRQHLTELQASENRYRALFERSNDGIAMVDLDDIILEVNQRVVDMAGTPRSNIVGKPVMDFIPPSEASKSSAQLETLLTGEEVPVYERILRRADGTEFPAELSISLVYDKDGIVTHWQSFIRDITDRKLAEKTSV